VTHLNVMVMVDVFIMLAKKNCIQSLYNYIRMK